MLAISLTINAGSKEVILAEFGFKWGYNRNNSYRHDREWLRLLEFNRNLYSAKDRHADGE